MNLRIKNWPRLRHRLIWHHAPLLGISAAATVAARELLFRDLTPVQQISLPTAYLSLIYIAISLLIGPIRLMLGKRSAVSEDLRRDVGIWAGITGLIHVIYGFQAHMQGQILMYFFESLEPLKPMINEFGAANTTGLIATLILALLFVLSNDLSLRLLGSQRWKQLQTLNYALGVIVIGHTYLYQGLEKRPMVYFILMAALTVFTLAVQIGGIVLYRRQAAQA